MKSLRSVFLALMLVLGLSSAASAQDIVVANATGFTIQQLGLIDSSASGDAQDLLGNDTLANGEALQISISGSPKGWELIATDGQGGQVNWQNLDLTGVSKITLHANGTRRPPVTLPLRPTELIRFLEKPCGPRHCTAWFFMYSRPETALTAGKISRCHGAGWSPYGREWTYPVKSQFPDGFAGQ